MSPVAVQADEVVMARIRGTLNWSADRCLLAVRSSTSTERVALIDSTKALESQKRSGQRGNARMLETRQTKKEWLACKRIPVLIGNALWPRRCFFEVVSVRWYALVLKRYILNTEGTAGASRLLLSLRLTLQPVRNGLISWLVVGA